MPSKDYFEKVADKWDRMREGFFSEKVRDVALATADVQRGCLAADLGAGTGFITEGLIKKGLDVIAVDQSDAMLKKMREKYREYVNIDYRIGVSDKLPLEDEAVDYVFANMFLHHTESPARALMEMARIAKAGGKIVVTDMDAHEFRFLLDEHHDRWPGFKREDVRKWFYDAGLKDFRIDCVGENCTTTSSKCCDSASINIFIAWGTK